MKKIVVLGCSGMAGHVLIEYMTKAGNYDIFGIARSKGNMVTHVLDVSDFSALKATLQEIKPDFVVNCVGVLVSKSSEDICTAISINSYLPNFLASLGNQFNFKLIHISTDCVFSGKTGSYHEDSFRDGDDNYARTKALGEVVNKNDLTIRTSIIGPELKHNGTGLLDWFLKQDNQIKGYSEAYWSGVTTLELAKAIDEFIKQNITGLYNLSPIKKISKYELLLLFSRIWSSNIQISKDENYKVDKSLVTIRKDFDFNVSDYSAMLVELHDWMNLHKDNYVHYNI